MISCPACPLINIHVVVCFSFAVEGLPLFIFLFCKKKKKAQQRSEAGFVCGGFGGATLGQFRTLSEPHGLPLKQSARFIRRVRPGHKTGSQNFVIHHTLCERGIIHGTHSRNNHLKRVHNQLNRLPFKPYVTFSQPSFINDTF